MIVYVDSKTDKVELTKSQLEILLKEEYEKGYKEGKKFQASTTYSCPRSWSCPYRNGNIYYTGTSTSGTATISTTDINTGITTTRASNVGSKLA